eukprot:2218791-Rhodomonas_salina.2
MCADSAPWLLLTNGVTAGTRTKIQEQERNPQPGADPPTQSAFSSLVRLSDPQHTKLGLHPQTSAQPPADLKSNRNRCRFKELQEVYEVLSNPNKRDWYDRACGKSGSSPRAPPSGERNTQIRSPHPKLAAPIPKRSGAAPTP